MSCVLGQPKLVVRFNYYFMESMFTLIWGIIFVSIITIFLVLGKRELNRFGVINPSEIKYKENFVSAYYPKKGFGGAKNSMQIIVTENILCLTTISIFAWIAKRERLLRKINLGNIKGVETQNKHIVLVLSGGSEKEERISLLIANVSSFLEAIKVKKDKISGFELIDGKLSIVEKKIKTPLLFKIISLILSSFIVLFIYFVENKGVKYDANLIYYHLFFYGILLNSIIALSIHSLLEKWWSRQI